MNRIFILCFLWSMIYFLWAVIWKLYTVLFFIHFTLPCRQVIPKFPVCLMILIYTSWDYNQPVKKKIQNGGQISLKIKLKYQHFYRIPHLFSFQFLNHVVIFHFSSTMNDLYFFKKENGNHNLRFRFIRQKMNFKKRRKPFSTYFDEISITDMKDQFFHVTLKEAGLSKGRNFEF